VYSILQGVFLNGFAQSAVREARPEPVSNINDLGCVQPQGVKMIDAYAAVAPYRRDPHSNEPVHKTGLDQALIYFPLSPRMRPMRNAMLRIAPALTQSQVSYSMEGCADVPCVRP
jgi:hypothetical protein